MVKGVEVHNLPGVKKKTATVLSPSAKKIASKKTSKKPIATSSSKGSLLKFLQKKASGYNESPRPPDGDKNVKTDNNECDDEYVKKTTFANAVGAIQKKIEKFGKLRKDELGDKCKLGGGRCSTHDVRLVRVQKRKLMSVIDKMGKVKWVNREVTSLMCPSKKRLSEDENEVVGAVSGEAEGTNRNVKPKLSDEMNQSDDCIASRKQ